MSENKPLRCQKCGRPIGYITITAKSVLETRPALDNVRMTGTCMDCSSGTGFYRRNF